MKLKKPKFVSSLSNLADWRSSNEEDITCNTEVGFVCSNEKQKSGICNDYQIRVLCSCSRYFLLNLEKKNSVTY